MDPPASDTEAVARERDPPRLFVFFVHFVVNNAASSVIDPEAKFR